MSLLLNSPSVPCVCLCNAPFRALRMKKKFRCELSNVPLPQFRASFTLWKKPVWLGEGRDVTLGAPVQLEVRDTPHCEFKTGNNCQSGVSAISKTCCVSNPLLPKLLLNLKSSHKARNLSKVAYLSNAVVPISVMLMGCDNFSPWTG